MDPNHKMLAAAVFLLLSMGTLYYFKGKDPIVPLTTTPTPTQVIALTPTSSPNSFTVALTSQNNSGVSGEVVFRELNGKVMVSLDLIGFTPGVSLPAHIHAGSCASLAPAVTYPLINPTNGKSDTILDVSLAELRSQLPLAVNLHKSQQEPKTYISCGNLSL
jgi:hypothetical protein